jgi:hypothetical protein
LYQNGQLTDVNVGIVICFEEKEFVLLQVGVVLQGQDRLQGQVVVRVDKIFLQNVLEDVLLS